MLSTFKTVPLEYAPDKQLHYNEAFLEPYCRELLDLLEGEDYMQSLSFAKRMMMSQEIKSNNNIEGITDDLSVIDEVIKSKVAIPTEERQRIINLYHGYEYILKHSDINKESLRELYSILSSGLLNSYDRTYMGEYYRTRKVHILKGIHIGDDMFEGMPVDKIEDYMSQYFAYINDDSQETEMSAFLKSQIMHFYFVYIHPYFDINGRTSRTMAMWYLLNNKSYPYIIFNQAIAFAKHDYEKAIICSRSHGDISLFLRYMITHVELELEKEHVLHSIEQNSTESLSKEDLQMLNYLLTMKSNPTAKDLATFYNSCNPPRKPAIVLQEKIAPLLEKGVVLNKGTTKGFIIDGVPNIHLGINRDLISVEPVKVKHLSLDRCI